MPLAACAASAFAMAAWVQWLRGAAPGIDDDTWLRAPLFGWLHAHAGLSLSTQLLLLPLAFVAALAIVLVVLEAIVFVTRVDRADRSWASLAWSFRGWRAALVWCLVVVVVSALLAGLAHRLEPMAPAAVWMPIALEWMGPPVLAFLAWNAAALAAPTPATWWRPRWPGLLAVALGATWIATFIAATSIVVWLGHPVAWWAYVAVVVPVAYVAEATTLIAWLNRSRLPLPAVFARACRWRVLAPLVLVELRMLAWVALVLLPIAPAYVVLVLLAPSLEELFRQYPGELPSHWMDLALVSRFAVAWWWLISIGVVGVAKVPLMWIEAVAKGRVFVELGLVEVPNAGPPSPIATPTPPTHPDCDPASTAPPTA